MIDRFLPQIFLGNAQRALLEKGVPVFVYHNIAAAPRGCRDPFLYTVPETFDRQLAALRAAGFSSAGLDEIYETSAGVNEGKCAVISFDDGCRNVWQNAAPILQKHRFQAVEFIVAGLIGKRNEWDIKHGDAPEPLMDETEIREWLAAGHAIGSHSLTHRNLAHLSRGDAREEIRASKKLLEDRFGIPVAHFCYPHGKHTPLLHELVCEAGYATACTTEFGVNDSSSPRFGLKRIFPLPARDFAAKLRHRIARKLRSFTGKQAAETCA